MVHKAVCQVCCAARRFSLLQLFFLAICLVLFNDTNVGSSYIALIASNTMPDHLFCVTALDGGPHGPQKGLSLHNHFGRVDSFLIDF